MLTLIMLCGQGGCGKSTFAKKIVDKFNVNNNIEICSMDKIVAENGFLDDNLFINDIQKAINSPQNKCVIIDYCFDAIHLRKKYLSSLQFPDEINLVIISVRPLLKTLIKWQEQRQDPNPLDIDQIIMMVRIYDAYAYPTEEEFSYINYNNLSILTINPEEED